MSVQVILDGQDITADLNAQYPLPDAISTGIFPSKEAGRWYDLLPVINGNETLKKNYFNGGDYGVHELKVVDPDGRREFDMRILLRLKYSARNH